MSSFEVRPLGAALGAEVVGIDLSKPLPIATVTTLRQAFLEHLVLFFRDQHLTPKQQLAFARLFGMPMPYPQLKGLHDCPLVTPVIKLEHETMNFGGVWHTDTAYLDCPPMASMLYAIETPPRGGDTLFANQYLAYETLPQSTRKQVDHLIAVNTSTKPEASRTREDRQLASGDTLKVLVARHPAVRTHPETGRKSLYINVGHTTHFEGLTRRESERLLATLFEHQTRSEFFCRFQWKSGSLAFWDNRCTLHYPINDYDGYRRIMHRVTLAGDAPF
ncbi:MAG: taurine dioxygenase [Burkholderiales bacterium]|nr:taurine dioxygenase [Burkholderiales bacterium]